MDNIFLIVVTTFLIAAVFGFITFFITRKGTNKKFRTKVNELDVEKKSAY